MPSQLAHACAGLCPAPDLPALTSGSLMEAGADPHLVFKRDRGHQETTASLGCCSEPPAPSHKTIRVIPVV
ncbi:hypothetical protein [Comamonas composti]|uniref:hypothetical protein n=1 Tax=Comamonas composti TaxID=408558 RepID=UPI0012EC4574|nr:hypothetical protein [Comamonas composti]